MAAAVLSRFPDFSAEVTRSLVLLSAERLPLADSLEGSPSARSEGERHLVGFGIPSVRRAIESNSHRAVLVAAAEIPIDGVHIYEVPVPTSFMQSGGRRGIEIALSFSPRTRVRRLDYMASRMEFHLVKGLPVERVSEVFARLGGDDLEAEDETEPEPLEVDASGGATDGNDAAEGEGPDAPSRPPTPSELKSHLVNLDSPAQVRSRGANQLGRRVFAQRLDADRDAPMFIVVRNINRWEDPTASESYALSVALWRDEGHREIHAELEAQLEAVIEVPVEVELEL